MQNIDSLISTNLILIKDKIKKYCDLVNRSPKDIELIAVSKYQSIEKITCSYNAGQKIFGENYIQELLTKNTQLNDLNIEWKFIGKLQSNKISKIVRVASEIQTIDNFKHAALVAKYAKEYNIAPYPIYLQLNAENESQKNGVSFQEIKKLEEKIMDELYNLLIIRGIMCIPPYKYQDENYKNVPQLYKDIFELSTTIGEKKLSLGMSGDLGIAIMAGSTCIRIGTAIFGERVNE